MNNVCLVVKHGNKPYLLRVLHTIEQDDDGKPKGFKTHYFVSDDPNASVETILQIPEDKTFWVIAELRARCQNLKFQHTIPWTEVAQRVKA